MSKQKSPLHKELEKVMCEHAKKHAKSNKAYKEIQVIKKKATRLARRLIKDEKMFNGGLWDLEFSIDDDIFYPSLIGASEDFPMLVSLLEFCEPAISSYGLWPSVNAETYDDRVSLAFDDIDSAEKFIKRFKLRVNTESEKQKALKDLRRVEKFMKMCDNVIVESGALYGEK